MKSENKNKVEAANEVMPTAESNTEVKPIVKKSYKPRKKHNKQKQEQKVIVLAVDVDETTNEADVAVLDVFESESVQSTKKEKFKLLTWLKKILKW